MRGGCFSGAIWLLVLPASGTVLGKMMKYPLYLFSILGGALGFVLPAYFISRLKDLVEGNAELVVVLVLSLGPLALLITVFATGSVKNIERYKEPLFWFLSAAELGYAIFLFIMLLYWYKRPEINHIEPLVVIISSGIAALHWSRKQWKDFDADDRSE